MPDLPTNPPMTNPSLNLERAVPANESQPGVSPMTDEAVLIKKLERHTLDAYGDLEDDLNEAIALIDSQRAEIEWLTSKRLMRVALDGSIALVECENCATANARAEALAEALNIAWKHAVKMRNATRLVGPYPNDAQKTKIWERSLYHQGKERHYVSNAPRSAPRLGGGRE